MTTLFGIKNCDSVKKARKWLDKQDTTYLYHDFRENGVDTKMLQTWLKDIEVSVLINKRSTTWKQLSDTQKALFESKKLSSKAVDIVLTQPTLIKRPILQTQKTSICGFCESTFLNILSA